MPPVRFALLLGLAVGLAEVAVQSSPVRGLGMAELAVWAGCSVGFGVALAELAVFAGWAVSKAGGRVQNPWSAAVISAVVGGIYAAVNYRYSFVLNNFVRDPAVWIGVPAVGLVGAGASVLLGRVLWRWPTIMLATAALCAVAIPLRAGNGGGKKRTSPNVLLISMDTVRADAVADLPTFSRLAREGTRFTQAIAGAPITEPSHLALFTGIAPFHSGVVSNGTDLGDRPALIWKNFADEGYLTAGFVSGFPLHGKYGWGQGTTVWDDDFGDIPGIESLTAKKLFNQFFLKEHALRERSAAPVLSRAERWIRAHRGESTFTFVHFYDAHGPYHSPHNAELGQPGLGAALPLPAWWPAKDRAIADANWLARAYQAEVADVDAAVGQLISALGPDLDQTIVVVTADHGESLTEHGYYFDHGDNLYDPSLRVPLVVRYPPKVKAGNLIDCQTASVDVAPTILALAGIADTAKRDGISRQSELGGAACEPEVVVSSTTAGRFVATPPVDHALRSATAKLIRKGNGGAELYDLVSDPGELRNLAPSPESAAGMVILDAMLQGGGPVVGPEMDAETLAALRALGYVDPEGKTP